MTSDPNPVCNGYIAKERPGLGKGCCFVCGNPIDDHDEEFKRPESLTESLFMLRDLTKKARGEDV